MIHRQAPRSNLPEIEKKKFLVPGTMSLGLKFEVSAYQLDPFIAPRKKKDGIRDADSYALIH